MNTEKRFTLPDGRNLSYAEFGRPDGQPVLYFHGAPGSRLEPLLFDEDAFDRAGLRIIAPDRPGMGRSDFQPGRGFSHWPPDVGALADGLGLGQFSILANSGGSGYAAVCAAKIPHRLRSVVIVSGGWQMNQPEALKNLSFTNRVVWNIIIRAPRLMPVLLKMMAGSPDDKPEDMLAQFKRTMPPADYAVLEKPGRVKHLMQMTREALAQGPQGAAWDMQLYARDWDFRLAEIRIPLKLFHGEQDRNLPIALVRKMLTQLPTAQLIAYENEAHLSTPCNHLDEIIQALVNSS